MECSLLLVADYANIEQHGKLNVMGIFQSINAQSFPVRHPSMFVVIRLLPELGDSEGDTRTLTLKLLDQDGKELAGFSQEFEIPPSTGGQRSEINTLLELRDLVFPNPGTYDFVVLVDKDPKNSTPIYVNKVQAQQG